MVCGMRQVDNFSDPHMLIFVACLLAKCNRKDSVRKTLGSAIRTWSFKKVILGKDRIAPKLCFNNHVKM
jgi:hypothetical protein